MDSKTASALIERIRQKKADLTGQVPALAAPAPAPAVPGSGGQAFANAVTDMNTANLKGDALRDIRNVALAALGVGVAGRGTVGLLNSLQRDRQKKPKGPSLLLPLPYPAEKAGNFLGGDSAATKAGIPWYMPAMMMGSLAGLGGGWAGMDAVLHRRRKAETDAELNKARAQFHDALLSQYDAPLQNQTSITAKVAADAPEMVKVAQELDAVWDLIDKRLEKGSFDFANAAGVAAGGYGTYAGLSGLLTGALVYDKVAKRSRRAILQKAMQRRDRRNFTMRPNEIYAIPEPVSAPAAPVSPAALASDPEE